MNSRIQQALDGELARKELGSQEAAEMLRVEALMRRVLRTVPDDSAPDLAPAVLKEIQHENLNPKNSSSASPAAAPVAWRRLSEWFWKPRAVSVMWRPAYALVPFAVVMLMMTVGPLSRSQPNSDVTVARPQVLVHFRLDAPQARAVALAGEFTEWEPLYTMNQSTPGTWTVVVPLDPGIHEYGFIVDGDRWVPDPMAPAVADGFGGLNSRIAVLIPNPWRPL